MVKETKLECRSFSEHVGLMGSNSLPNVWRNHSASLLTKKQSFKEKKSCQKVC